MYKFNPFQMVVLKEFISLAILYYKPYKARAGAQRAPRLVEYFGVGQNLWALLGG